MEDSKNKKIILFFTLQEINPSEGISKKILAEQKAFQSNGYNCLLGRIDRDRNNNFVYKIGDSVITNYGKGIVSKFSKLSYYKNILKWIETNREHIALIYVRYTHFSNIFFCHLFKAIHELSIKVALEIPTYPYDREYDNCSLRCKFLHWEEKRTRQNLAKYVNIIITFSDDDEIWNCKTIKINNAIDLSTIPVRTTKQSKKQSINLLGVANLMYWHGYDRIIKSLKAYYTQNKFNIPIYFHIVGGDTRSETYKSLQDLVLKSNLADYVIFHGVKSGIDLDNLFNGADIAVGCLGCHRKGLQQVQSIKNVEYAARGIPFIYSEDNYLFDKSPYVFKASADEEIIDFTKITTFLQKVNLTPEEIRDSVKELTWHNQMKKIIRLLLN